MHNVQFNVLEDTYLYYVLVILILQQNLKEKINHWTDISCLKEATSKDIYFVSVG